MLSVLTFNAGLMEVKVLGRTVWRPLPAVAARLEALAAALRRIDADIVCLQEVYHRRNQAWLRRALADRYPHAAGMEDGGLGPAGLRFGSSLMVLSRVPMVEARTVEFHRAMPEERLFTNRGMLAVTIQPHGVERLRLVTLHASAGGLFRHPESRGAEAIRAAQIRQALELVRGDGSVLLAGDLNAGPEASPQHFRRLLDAGFTDAFAAAGGEGVSWHPDNPLVRNGTEAHLPPQRIDHVLLNAEAAGRLRPAEAHIVFDQPAVMERGARLPLSDHYGVLVRLAPVC